MNVLRGWVLLGTLLALGLVGMQGYAALAISDTDSDGVPDVFDNCSLLANGPAAGTLGCWAQEDGDLDGYGNACDSDFNNDSLTLVGDTAALMAGFASNDANLDLDCDGRVLGADVTRHEALLGTAPGPSGLSCAGTIPCQ
jgi:hypothetical protein